MDFLLVIGIIIQFSKKIKNVPYCWITKTLSAMAISLLAQGEYDVINRRGSDIYDYELIFF